MKHEKAPTTPRFQGALTISYMPFFMKNQSFRGILAKFGHFRWLNLAKPVKRHIYKPKPFIWAYSQVSTTIRCRETAWKGSCFEKPQILDILAKFGHFRWPILAETFKRHISRPRPFIWVYSKVSTTIRCKETAWKSSCFEKRKFWTFWSNSAISGGKLWPKLSKGTSTGQDLSYEPIPWSLRSFVAKIQPGKESMTDRRTDIPNL